MRSFLFVSLLCRLLFLVSIVIGSDNNDKSLSVPVEDSMDQVFQNLGAQVISKASGMELSTALSLLKTTRTETHLKRIESTGYEYIASHNTNIELYVEKQYLEKKIQQVLDFLKVPDSARSVISDTLGAAVSDSDLVLGSNTGGGFSLYFIRVKPISKDLQTYAIQGIHATGSLKLFPHTDFTQITKANVISSKSFVRVTSVPREVRPEDIAFAWNLMAVDIKSKMPPLALPGHQSDTMSILMSI